MQALCLQTGSAVPPQPTFSSDMQACFQQHLAIKKTCVKRIPPMEPFAATTTTTTTTTITTVATAAATTTTTPPAAAAAAAAATKSSYYYDYLLPASERTSKHCPFG